ncbi:MAG: hypothetical protein IPG54_09255 [Sphingomonadales bacterium]|jgi:hypothetical protein|nr:hypothetical protein [Sphingomonadales bacterium]MBK9005025.1 hypothetical protein [Sphingomonadales bacterium]MBK9267242.1 hypothetical protein [Sphingomonadales bacterium]MBP6433570.1 hypothetical protein [Sphingorhabdus sp.]
MAGWIFALAAAASSSTPETPARIQAIATATVTIIRLEQIDVSRMPERGSDAPRRQLGTRQGAPQIDFY